MFSRDWKIAILILIGVVLCTMSYNVDDAILEYRLHDSGQILFPIAVMYLVNKSLVLSLVVWIWFSGTLNSLITSMLYDVSVFGDNQKVFIFALVISILLIGIYILYERYKRNKIREELCKKNAKDKYKNLLSRMDIMETKMTHYDKSIENFLNHLF
jgi:uncharacterized membrane protein